MTSFLKLIALGIAFAFIALVVVPFALMVTIWLGSILIVACVIVFVFDLPIAVSCDGVRTGTWRRSTGFVPLNKD